MPVSNGDIIVYNGSQWANQKTMSGPLTVDSPTFYVDSTNHRVGVGTTSPQFDLNVAGRAGTYGLILVTGESFADLWLGHTGTGGRTFAMRSYAGLYFIIDATAATVRFAIDASGNTGIGNTAGPHTRLQVLGPIATAVTTVTTGPYTVTADDSVVRVDTTSAAITVNLPTAVGITGRKYTIKLVAGANNVTVTPSGVQTIDGAANYTLGALYKYVALVSNGSNWDVVANN